MRFLLAIGLYGLVAFCIGFALLSYELVATRILAPRIGSSIYVWTSIIGVIIAALSLGFAAGGIIADRRVRATDVSLLLLASSTTVLFTIINAPIALSLVGTTFSDPRLQGVLTAVWLFLPTSFLIGMVSPYLARLKTVSVDTTGTTIASLDAMNAIGGIAGTFVTGFIMFAYIGSIQSLLIISMVLLIASWLIQPSSLTKFRLGATLAIILLAGISMAASRIKEPSVVASIDTPTAHYKVVDTKYGGRPVRALTSGPGGMQSGIYRDGSSDLAFTYTRAIATLTAAAPQKRNILVLGGGTFTLPQYFSITYPGTVIDVVEIDEALLPVARKYFAYKDPSNVNIISEDARAYLNHNQKRYDIIVVDVYTDTLIPHTLSTREYTAQLRRSLQPQGTVLANIIGSDRPECRQLLRSLHGSYKTAFPSDRTYPLVDATYRAEQNIIAAYSGEPLNWAPPARSELNSSHPFTDNHVPVEHLKQQCTASSL